NENIDFFSNLNPTPFPYNGTYTPTYYWDFDDGNTQSGTTLQDVTNSYASAGTYEVMLEVSIDDCSFIYTQDIDVLNNTENIIEPENSVICGENDEITLHSTISNGDYYRWYDANDLTTPLSEGTDAQSFTSSYGEYYLEIDVDADTYTGTANIFYFEPSFTHSGTYEPHEIITFSANLLATPSSYDGIYTPTYSWDVDGNPLSDETQVVDMIFDGVGIYSVTLSVFIDMCVFEYSEEIEINGNIISPQDTVVCNENDEVELLANGYYGKYFEWKREDETIIDGDFDLASIVVDEPDKYILVIKESESSTDIIASDTANVFFFNPTINAPATANVGQEVTFIAHINETPIFNNFTDIEFFWDFDDGNTESVMDYHEITHSFSISGIYAVNLSLNVEDCSFQTSKNININNSLLEIIQQDTVLCDTNIAFPITVDATTEHNIEWHSNNGLFDGENGLEIWTKQPGKYWVDIYNSGYTWVASDTIFIDYKKCYDFDVNIIANETSTCSNDFIFTFEAVLSDQTGNCTVDAEDCYFIWNLGDGNNQQGLGLTNIEYSYEHGGNFGIKLYVFDPKSCEHIANSQTLIQATTPDSDTIQILVSSFDDIIVNLFEHNVFEADFYRNNKFITS
ncbi:MAG: PKD domain-containing protein, partial [Candidatus Cloacimonadota bacterium]|nr:PKD domain-containing protein [Candidatus Cloacimonadota bacterium]